MTETEGQDGSSQAHGSMQPKAWLHGALCAE